MGRTYKPLTSDLGLQNETVTLATDKWHWPSHWGGNMALTSDRGHPNRLFKPSRSTQQNTQVDVQLINVEIHFAAGEAYISIGDWGREEHKFSPKDSLHLQHDTNFFPSVTEAEKNIHLPSLLRRTAATSGCYVWRLSSVSLRNSERLCVL